MWVCLHEQGMTPTNNHTERVLGVAVLWRKRSLGTKSDKGDRWVERIRSWRQTRRERGRQIFPALVEARTCYFKGQPQTSPGSPRLNYYPYDQIPLLHSQSLNDVSAGKWSNRVDGGIIANAKSFFCYGTCSKNQNPP